MMKVKSCRISLSLTVSFLHLEISFRKELLLTEPYVLTFRKRLRENEKDPLIGLCNRIYSAKICGVFFDRKRV